MRKQPAAAAAKAPPFPGLHVQQAALEQTLDRLRAGPVRAPGASDVAFADLRFPTPSGRIELLSEEAARRAMERASNRPLILIEAPSSMAIEAAGESAADDLDEDDESR